MKTSGETLYLAKRFGDKRAVQILAEAGFDNIDYTMDHMVRPDSPLNAPDYVEYAKSLRAVAADYGVGFNQAHAPFEFDWEHVSIEQHVIPATIRSLEVASIMGIDTVVVHPLHYKNYFHHMDEVWNDNIRFFSALLPYAEKYNVRICLENLFQFDTRGVALPDTCADAKRYIAAIQHFHSPHLIGCVDVGHACLVGEKPGNLIRALGHDIVHALHIHDNHAVVDDHTMPYLGKIDWEDVTKALAEIDYDGVFTLESFFFYKNFPDDFIPTVARWQREMAAYLANKVEEYKDLLRR